MPNSWQSADLLDPTLFFSSFSGGNATFDEDGDLSIFDTSSENFVGIFTKPLVDYQWLELTIQNLNPTSNVDFFITFLSDATGSTLVSPQARRAVTVNAFSIQTFKIPYVGEIEGFTIRGIDFQSGIKIKHFSVIHSDDALVSSIPETLTNTLEASGFSNLGNGQYRKLLDLGEVVGFIVNFAAVQDRWIRIRVDSTVGLANFSTFYAKGNFLSLGSNALEFMFEEASESSPININFTAPGSGLAATVTVTITEVSFSAKPTAFGLGNNGTSILAPVIPSSISLLASANLWTGKNDFAGIVSLPGTGYVKASGVGNGLIYSEGLPEADIVAGLGGTPWLTNNLTVVSQLENDASYINAANSFRLLFGFEPDKLSTNVLNLNPGSIGNSNGTAIYASSTIIQIDLTTVGAGGLDAGAVVNGTMYYIYMIVDASGNLSAVASDAIIYGDVVVPAGYTLVRKLPFGFPYDAVKWDGIPDFHLTHWPQPFIRFTAAEESNNWRALHAIAGANVGVWTDVDLSPWVPDNAREAYIMTRVGPTAAAGPTYAKVRTYATQAAGITCGYATNDGKYAYFPLTLRVTSDRKIQYQTSAANSPAFDIFVLGFDMTEPV